MKPPVFLLFICLLSVTKLVAQQNDNYFTYYKTINAAEMGIVENKFDVALHNYQVAFSLSNVYPFAKDYYNAAICAVKLEKKAIAFRFLSSLIERGLDKEILTSDSLFLPIVSKRNFGKKIKIRAYNQQLIDSLKLLYEKDQHFRKMTGSYKVYGDTIKKIDRENDAILRSIINRYDYPSEKLVGLGEGIRFDKNFEIVIWHQTTLNYISNYVNILENAAKRGLLIPQRAAVLIENHTGETKYAIWSFYKVQCETCGDSLKQKVARFYYCYDLSEKMIAKYNSARAEIGVESLEDYNRKILFWLKHKEYKFFVGGAIPTFSFVSDTDMNQFIGRMKTIPK